MEWRNRRARPGLGLARGDFADRAGKSAGVQRQLAQSRHGNMRYKLAGDAELLPECAELLAQDKDVFVRRQLAENKAADEALVSALARDKDPTVRAVALKSDQLSPQTLDALADDASPDVVDGVAQHWKTPGAALARIAARGLTPRRSAALAARVATPPELLNQLSAQPELHKVLAANPALPSQAARAVAKNKDWQVRCALAENANADLEALESMIDDPQYNVRMRLASHTRFTRLGDLATDPSDVVREWVARRKDAPLEVLESLARDESAAVRKVANETLKKKVG